MKNLFILISVIGLLTIVPPCSAVTEADMAAKIANTDMTHQKDIRELALNKYLKKYNSPMSQSSRHFIKESDRLNLDWRLIPAIAGLESTYGIHIPVGSYNAYGWGIFTGKSSGIVFETWEDGITKVSEGIRYNYIDKGAKTVEQIGRIYAASPTWAQRVLAIMQTIEKSRHDAELLELTL